MAAEEMKLLPTSTATLATAHHRLDNGGALNPSHHQLLFQHGENTVPLHRPPPFYRHSGDPVPKTTRELTTGFIDDSHRFFQSQQPSDFRHALYAAPIHAWNVNGRPSDGRESDGDEDDDDDDDDDDDELDEVKINNSSNSRDDISNNGKPFNLSSSFGSNRGCLLRKEKNVVATGDESNINDTNNCDNVGASSCDNQFQNAVTIAGTDGDMYYSQHYLHVQEGSTSVGHKDVALVENGCGFSGRKDVFYSTESGDSLRKVLSDPLTGSLMDDAMILLCGHSFGGGGIQHVIKMKACYSCSQPVSEESVATNLSLRAAVQAFRREEEMQVYRASKRRREKLEQDKSNYGDISLLDHPRGKGVQFPYSVTDRVIIKGNKRTPQRFVGREAVVTTQCLNGWYVVKTLDNAESVKLQYRSLAKVSDDAAAKPLSTKMTPNWL